MKVINALFGTLALIMACIMCAMYGTKLSLFDDDEYICMAIRGEEGDLETIDVGDKWLFVIKFGFGCWLAMIFLSLLGIFSGFSPVIMRINQPI